MLFKVEARLYGAIEESQLDIIEAPSFEEALKLGKKLAKDWGYEPSTANVSEIWDTYSDAGLTFVMLHHYDYFPTVVAWPICSTDVIGFYYGEPNDEDTIRIVRDWMGDF